MSSIKINFKKHNPVSNENFFYFIPMGSPIHLSHSSWSPLTDICVSNDILFIISDLSGVNLKDISLTYTKNFFVISGFRKFPLSGEEQKFHHKEIGYGVFEKKLKLPFTIDTDSIEATLKNGFLIIKAKKIPKNEAVKINIT